MFAENKRRALEIGGELIQDGLIGEQRCKKYISRINENKKQICLGIYKTKEEAAKAYDDYIISIGKQPINFVK